MTALIIIASVLLLIAVILFHMVKVRITYKDEFDYSIKLGFINIPPEILSKKSRKKKKKKNQESKESVKKKPLKEEITATVKEEANSLIDLLKTLKIVLPHFNNEIYLKSRKFNITVCGESAADVALECAEFKIAAIAVFSFIDNYINIKSKSLDTVQIVPDFCGSETTFDIDFDFRARLYTVIRLEYHILKTFIQELIKEEMEKEKQREMQKRRIEMQKNKMQMQREQNSNKKDNQDK